MEEKELVQQSKEGNEEAFASLVKKYKTKIFNLARLILRFLSFSLSQDLVLGSTG
jgi:hypothetical protein